MKPRVLTYDIAGDGDPLVLVPGGLTGWLSWIPHQERLSDRYRVIRVQPIHNELGTAGKAGDPSYTRDTERESLLLTLDELEIERSHFAGWSRGGKALIDFTAVHPGRVISLTLVEPAAYWILEELGETDFVLERLIRHIHRMAGATVTEDDLAAFLSSAGFADDPGRAREGPYWDRALPHRMALSWASDESMGSDFSVADVATIRCPVLLTRGTRTERWERRVVEILGTHIPDVRVAEFEGGHAHHIESLEPFLVELDTHLRARQAV